MQKTPSRGVWQHFSWHGTCVALPKDILRAVPVLLVEPTVEQAGSTPSPPAASRLRPALRLPIGTPAGYRGREQSVVLPCARKEITVGDYSNYIAESHFTGRLAFSYQSIMDTTRNSNPTNASAGRINVAAAKAQTLPT